MNVKCHGNHEKVAELLISVVMQDLTAKTADISYHDSENLAAFSGNVIYLNYLEQ